MNFDFEISKDDCVIFQNDTLQFPKIRTPKIITLNDIKMEEFVIHSKAPCCIANNKDRDQATPLPALSVPVLDILVNDSLWMCPGE